MLLVAYIRVILLKEAEVIKMKKAFNIFGKEVELAGSRWAGPHERLRDLAPPILSGV